MRELSIQLNALFDWDLLEHHDVALILRELLFIVLPFEFEEVGETIAHVPINWYVSIKVFERLEEFFELGVVAELLESILDLLYGAQERPIHHAKTDITSKYDDYGREPLEISLRVQVAEADRRQRGQGPVTRNQYLFEHALAIDCVALARHLRVEHHILVLAVVVDHVLKYIGAPQPEQSKIIR